MKSLRAAAVLVAILVPLALPASAPALSCIAQSKAEAIADAEVIIVAQALPGPTVDGGASGRGELLSPARFRVLEYEKGHGPEVVEVYTAHQSATTMIAGGFSPREGQIWRLGGNRDRDGRISTGCAIENRLDANEQILRADEARGTFIRTVMTTTIVVLIVGAAALLLWAVRRRSRGRDGGDGSSRTASEERGAPPEQSPEQRR